MDTISANAYGILTPIELEIVADLANGLTVKKIGIKRERSAKTIDAHKSNIMKKLDIHNRAELTKWAIRNGVARL